MALPAIDVLAAESASAGPGWAVGCFNRAWTKWSYDAALQGVQDAGYKLTGLLSRHPFFAPGAVAPTPKLSEAFIGVEATPEYLDALQTKVNRASTGIYERFFATRVPETIQTGSESMRQTQS